MSNTKQESFATYRRLVDEIQECMLVTEDQQIGLRARPMYLAECDEQGKLWFFTAAPSEKVNEIYHDRTVCCAFARPEDKSYVSASGEAIIVKDLTRKKELYSKINDAWFDGPEDPRAALICVKVREVEYWEDNDSSIVTMAKIAVSAVTGNRYDDTENEKISL